MKTDSSSQSTDLVSLPQATMDATSSNLAKRGLDDFDDEKFTDEEIVAARLEGDGFTGLSDESVRIAVKKPRAWEYRLFFQVLIDEVNGYESIRQSRSWGFMPGVAEVVERAQASAWIQDRFAEQLLLLEQSETLISQDLVQAWGAPGQPGDVSDIVKVARQLGLIYKQFLEISIRCASVKHEPLYNGVFWEMSKMDDGIIKKFEEFPSTSLSSVMKFAASSSEEQEPLSLSMNLEMDSDALLAEFKKLEKAITAGH